MATHDVLTPAPSTLVGTAMLGVANSPTSILHNQGRHWPHGN